MIIVHLFLALAGAVTIMAISSNITIATNAIPGNTTTISNLTSSEKDFVKLATTNAIPGNTTTTSNLTSSEKDFVRTDATPNRCRIHVNETIGNEKSPYHIKLFSFDWNNNTQYIGDCQNSICSWPLLHMSDILFSIRSDDNNLQFYRTLSPDSWDITDKKRCKVVEVPQWGTIREIDCDYECAHTCDHVNMIHGALFDACANVNNRV